MLGFNRSDNGMVPYEGRESLFDRLFDEPFFPALMQNVLRTDIREDEQAYTVAVDIPGVDKKDIALDYTDEGTLTVSVTRAGEKEEQQKGFLRRERSVGRSSRAYYLPGVRREGIAAKYESGVLTVTLPKGGEQKSASIQVQ